MLRRCLGPEGGLTLSAAFRGERRGVCLIILLRDAVAASTDAERTRPLGLLHSRQELTPGRVLRFASGGSRSRRSTQPRTLRSLPGRSLFSADRAVESGHFPPFLVLHRLTAGKGRLCPEPALPERPSLLGVGSSPSRSSPGVWILGGFPLQVEEFTGGLTERRPEEAVARPNGRDDSPLRLPTPEGRRGCPQNRTRKSGVRCRSR